MKKALQIITQVLFLALFIVLFAIGRIQLWMFLFGAGIVATVFFGRIFCGWICPIGTLMRGITWIKKKLHIKSFKIPRFLKKPWVRFAMLGIFIAVFVFTMVTGKRLPVLPALLGLGVLITLFFPEELWHRYLCPYGTILSLPGRISLHSVQIDADRCTNCSICTNVCPADAIKKNGEQHVINKSDCLVCMECIRKCPKDSISYQ